jgi:hypothetical protein
VSHQLVEQEHAVVPDHVRVEFARPRAARAKPVGQLAEAKRLGGRREQVEQKLEPDPREAAHPALESLPTHHEEAAHGIGQIGAQDQAAEVCGKAARCGARLRPLTDPVLLHVAAADDHLDVLLLCDPVHLRQQSLVVLQIGVHHRDQRSGAGQNALDAG